MKPYKLALSLLIGCSLLSQAQITAVQFTDPLDGAFDMSDYLSENAFGFLPVPVIITEPAVDGGLGAVGVFFREDEGAAAERKEAMATAENAGDYLLPPSIFAGFGMYTGNDSWMLGAGHLGFYRDGKLRYQGGGGYGKLTLDYYSIAGVDLGEPVSIDTEAAMIIQSLKFKIGQLPLFIGPNQRFVDAKVNPASFGGLLPPGFPPELEEELLKALKQDVTLSSLGLVLEFDTRNNVFTPEKGLHYEVEYLAYRDEFASDIDYDLFVLSGLHYFPISKTFRGGVRLAGELADSDEALPVFALPYLNMRGIPAARYQGTHVGLIEAELTWQFTPRWSALGFGGVGRAANSSSEFKNADNRETYGLGMRYEIARRYGFHVGIDIARGPEDTVFYIQAGSAW